jgi:hypothetical protein
MSTRSAIIIDNADGTAEGIYCHNDGYPEHHAPILLKYYNTEPKVRALIALGAISVLGPTIGRKHSFGKAYPSTTAYHRDRDDDKWNMHDCSWQAIAQHMFGCEHAYVFQAKDDKWYYCDLKDKSMTLLPLKE